MNLWNMNVTVITIVIAARGSHEMIDKGTGGLGNKRTSRDHPNYSTVMIGQDTEKSPGYLMKLAVTQTTMEDHQLMMVWKTLKEVKE